MKNEKYDSSLLTDVPDASWNKLCQKKIYFGHQSVGFNIIDGIEDLMKENPQINLNIIETNDIMQIKDGGLAHFKVGKNRDPKSKIDDFINNIGGDFDIVLLKFCYVDVNSNTNINEVFKAYSDAVSKFQTNYPDVIFIHATVPLKSYRKIGLKDRIKEMFGQKYSSNNDNIARNLINDLFRKKYKGKGNLFDIAMIESTLSTGLMMTAEVEGKEYFFMNPDFTDDGGHLNLLGRKRLAEQFLLMLLNLCD